MPDSVGSIFPPAETPKFHKDEMGKGVGIGGRVVASKGESLNVRGDKQASELRRVWGKATRAASRFKDIFS